MNAPACAVGRLGPGRPWIGFAPTLDDAYALVIGDASAARRGPADRDDLLSLAILYFEDGLDDPPEELAATQGDIAALVRHVLEDADEASRAALTEAVEGIDDGLGAEVVVTRLTRCLDGGEEPMARLERRAAELLARA